MVGMFVAGCEYAAAFLVMGRVRRDKVDEEDEFKGLTRTEIKFILKKREKARDRATLLRARRSPTRFRWECIHVA
jgi:hypothetical protein